MTRVLGHKLKQAGFRKADIAKRLDEIATFFRKRWRIPVPETTVIVDENDGSSSDDLAETATAQIS